MCIEDAVDRHQASHLTAKAGGRLRKGRRSPDVLADHRRRIRSARCPADAGKAETDPPDVVVVAVESPAVAPGTIQIPVYRPGAWPKIAAMRLAVSRDGRKIPGHAVNQAALRVRRPRGIGRYTLEAACRTRSERECEQKRWCRFHVAQSPRFDS